MATPDEVETAVFALRDAAVAVAAQGDGAVTATDARTFVVKASYGGESAFHNLLRDARANWPVAITAPAGGPLPFGSVLVCDTPTGTLCVFRIRK